MQTDDEIASTPQTCKQDAYLLDVVHSGIANVGGVVSNGCNAYKRCVWNNICCVYIVSGVWYVKLKQCHVCLLGSHDNDHMHDVAYTCNRWTFIQYAGGGRRSGWKHDKRTIHDCFGCVCVSTKSATSLYSYKKLIAGLPLNKKVGGDGSEKQTWRA